MDIQKVWYFNIFQKYVQIIQVPLKQYNNSNGTSHEDQYTFFIVSRPVLLRMRNVSDKFINKIKTQILCSIIFCLKSFRLTGKLQNLVETDRPQITILRKRFECWTRKATNTRSEYTIRIAFTLQQWLQERVSMLCYMYNASFCLFSYNFNC